MRRTSAEYLTKPSLSVNLHILGCAALSDDCGIPNADQIENASWYVEGKNLPSGRS